MKLIFCAECHDVIRLWQNVDRQCRCGASWGRYLDDDLTAQIGGQAIPLCIPNNALREAIAKRPDHGAGQRLNAFVIPRVCDTVQECGGESKPDVDVQRTS